MEERRRKEKEAKERNEIEGKWGEPEEEDGERTPERKGIYSRTLINPPFLRHFKVVIMCLRFPPSDLLTDDDRTPERSPTPRRGEGERLLQDNPEEDEEDSRLEAALWGELRKDDGNFTF